MVDRPRRPRGNRRRARLPPAQQPLRQRGRSVPGRGAGATRISSTSSGSGSCAGIAGVCTGCADRLLDLDRREPGPHLPAEAAGESAREQVVDVQRGPLRLPSRSRPAAAGAPPPRRREGTVRSLDWTAWPAELRPTRLRAGRAAGRRALAAILTRRRGLPAGKLLRGDRSAGGAGPGAGARASARTSSSPAGLRSRRRNAPIAAAWRRSWPTSPTAVMTFDEFLEQLDRGRSGGVWVSGGYKADWIDEPTARDSKGCRCWSCRTCSPRRLSQRATYELPGAAFAERDGSYVNRGDRLQTVGLGDPSALGRAAGGEPVLGAARAAAGFTTPGPCWTTRPARSSISRPPPVPDPGGREST